MPILRSPNRNAFFKFHIGTKYIAVLHRSYVNMKVLGRLGRQLSNKLELTINPRDEFNNFVSTL